MDNDVCCICLNSDIKLNKITTCCNNYIHEECLITWIIYSGNIQCCLCKSYNIDISSKDFMMYDINNIQEYNLDKTMFINNLNEMVYAKIDKDYTVINVNDNSNNIDVIDDVQYISSKHILTLLLIPVFYTIFLICFKS